MSSYQQEQSSYDDEQMPFSRKPVIKVRQTSTFQKLALRVRSSAAGAEDKKAKGAWRFKQFDFGKWCKENVSRSSALRFVLLNFPGMRILKTALAIFLAVVIGHYLGSSNITQSAVVALFCLGHNLKNTFESSLNRVIGTIVAGVFAYLFLLFLYVVLDIRRYSFLYTVLVVLFIIILMQLLVKLRRPGGAAIAAMTFLNICFSVARLDQIKPLAYTLESVALTLVGIFAALFADWLPPLNNLSKNLYMLKLEVDPRCEEDSKFRIEEFDEQSSLRSIFQSKKKTSPKHKE